MELQYLDRHNAFIDKHSRGLPRALYDCRDLHLVWVLCSHQNTQLSIPLMLTEYKSEAANCSFQSCLSSSLYFYRHRRIKRDFDPALAKQCILSSDIQARPPSPYSVQQQRGKPSRLDWINSHRTTRRLTIKEHDLRPPLILHLQCNTHV